MDELVETFAGYDQFQLALGSRAITAIPTCIGLVKMCTLPQGATNLVDDIMKAINKVLMIDIFTYFIINLH